MQRINIEFNMVDARIWCHISKISASNLCHKIKAVFYGAVCHEPTGDRRVREHGAGPVLL